MRRLATGSVDIPFDPNYEAGNDQLMNLTGGVLVIGTLYDTAGTGPGYMTGMHTGTTYPQLRFYDPATLIEVASTRRLLDESNIPSGGSIAHRGAKYSLVTADRMESPQTPSKLYAYEWDESWAYLGKTLLSSDGQWSQGLLVDGDRIYVAYHQGQHVRGDVRLAVFDSAWRKLAELEVTKYGGAQTAQRPWILKVGNRIYVSYDVATGGDRLKDWQAHVAIVEI
jgi:hypothetical protein